MLKRSQRTGISVASAILSLPAFFAAFAGAIVVYAFAVLGGYNGTALQAALKLLSSWRGRVVMILGFLIITHIALFIYLLIRFARGLALPLLAQLYCMTIVILAIGEKIRLLIVAGDAFLLVWDFQPAPCVLFVLYRLGEYQLNEIEHTVSARTRVQLTHSAISALPWDRSPRCDRSRSDRRNPAALPRIRWGYPTARNLPKTGSVSCR